LETITQSDVSGASPPLDVPMTIPRPAKMESIRLFLKSSEEDLARALLILLIPVAILEAVVHSVAKGFWFDEILTVIVSSQPHVSGIWDLLKHGVDGHPLGFYLIEHVMGKLGGNERVTFRVPSIAAFLCVMLCMFGFIRRRTGGLVASISVAALLLTNLYDPFAFEARSYALMVACIAVALLCYERVDSGKWAISLAMSLAAASSLHFYAAISFFPFGIAELTYLATEHKFRTRVWSGFVVGVLPYFVFWPILREQRMLYGAHFWATPTFWKFVRTFGELLRLVTSFSVAMFAAASIYVVYLAYTGKFRARPTSAPGVGFSLPDVALTLGFLAIPTVTFVLAKIGHGGISGRYVITTVLGVSLALSLVLSRLKKPPVFSVGLFVLSMFVFQEAAFWRFMLRPREVTDPLQMPAHYANELNLPLVMTNTLEFLPVWHRSSDNFKSHLFTLADPSEQSPATPDDTSALLLLTLRNYAPIHALTFSEFALNHRRFLLYSNGDVLDYWPQALVQRGYSLRVVAVEPPVKGLRDDAPDPPRITLYFVDLDEHK
jgi:hypothetical protein